MNQYDNLIKKLRLQLGDGAMMYQIESEIKKVIAPPIRIDSRMIHMFLDTGNYKVDEALAKPPAGRSQKHHNNIIKLNKKRRGA